MQGTRGAHNKIILINLSLGFVTGLAPKAGKMIGLPKQERWAHHACSGLDGFVKLRKHEQKNNILNLNNLQNVIAHKFHLSMYEN